MRDPTRLSGAAASGNTLSCPNRVKTMSLNLYQFVVRRKGAVTSTQDRENSYKALIFLVKSYSWSNHEAMHNTSVG